MGGKEGIAPRYLSTHNQHFLTPHLPDVPYNMYGRDSHTDLFLTHPPSCCMIPIDPRTLSHEIRIFACLSQILDKILARWAISCLSILLRPRFCWNLTRSGEIESHASRTFAIFVLKPKRVVDGEFRSRL